MKLTTVDRLATAAVTAAAMIVLAGILGAAAGEEPDARESDAPPRPRSMALDEVIEEAMENNADVALARARVSEAEAELHRTRLLVAREVISLHHELRRIVPVRVRAAQEQLKLAETRFGRVRRHQEATGASEFDVEEAAIAVEQARREIEARLAERDELEADLRYMLGRMPQASGGGG